MIHMIAGVVESSIFFILSGLHFYWLFGGLWGLNGALPTNEQGDKVLNPGKFETAIVAFGLLTFGAFYLFKIGAISLQLPNWLMHYGGWIVIAIFIARSVGDFKYVGFFKKIRTTEFGKLDTKYYAPLCLILGLVGILVEFASTG